MGNWTRLWGSSLGRLKKTWTDKIALWLYPLALLAPHQNLSGVAPPIEMGGVTELQVFGAGVFVFVSTRKIITVLFF